MALVLALDVSGSVNEMEYREQITGLADALNAPDVRALLLDGSSPPVAISVFEWSSRNHQYVIHPWAMITDRAALDRLISRIRAHQKVRAGLKTALGTALSVGAEMLAQTSCWQRTIDVSGDGKNNIGPTPQAVYALPEFAGVTVNALVVGDPASARSDAAEVPLNKRDLLRYYENSVIRGPGAFAMIAEGYADYGRAMRRKLLRELKLPVFGQIEPSVIPPG